MIDLFFVRANEHVLLSENVSIKMVTENPFFKKKGKYTYEISIPAAKVNKFLYNVNRYDVAKTSFIDHANADNIILYAGARRILTGIYTVTSITDEVVKIQLLAGNSEFNYLKINTDIYVDELNIGAEYANSHYFIKKIYNPHLLPEQREKYCFGQYGETDVVCFPIHNETEDVIANDFVISPYKDWEMGGIGRCVNIRRGEDDSHYKTTPVSYYAPQPYLCHMIREVMKCLGYKVVRFDMENHPQLRNLFICNAIAGQPLAKCLPHWTVATFLNELENSFGLSFRFNEKEHTCSIISKSAYLSEKNYSIKKVVKAYSVDVEEVSENVTTSNLEYDFDDMDKYHLIPKEVYPYLTKKTFTSETEMQNYCNALPTGKDTTENLKKEAVLYECKGKHYIYITNESFTGLHEVNQYRPLDRGNKDNTISLRIVPCRMEASQVEVMRVSVEYSNDVSERIFAHASTPRLVTSGGEISCSDRSEEGYRYINIQKMLDEGVPAKNELDKMYIAVNDGNTKTVYSTTTSATYQYIYPATLYERIVVNQKLNKYFTFELNKIEGRRNMYSEVIALQATVDKRAKWHISFISNELIDPSGVFIINNRKFLCEKIETKITQEGVTPLQEGYFYEL